MNSSAMKNCRYWPRYLLPHMNWRNGDKLPFRLDYHISFAGMLYSVPHEYIKRKVDVRVTDKTIEVFYNHNRIASHRRLYGRKGQYSTITEHMPPSHQQYLGKTPPIVSGNGRSESVPVPTRPWMQSFNFQADRTTILP